MSSARFSRQLSVSADDSLCQIEHGRSTVSTSAAGTIGPCGASAKLVYVIGAVVMVVLAVYFGFLLGHSTGVDKNIGLALECQQRQQEQPTVWCQNLDDIVTFPKGGLWEAHKNDSQHPLMTRSKGGDDQYAMRDHRQYPTYGSVTGRRCGQRFVSSAHLYLDWPTIGKHPGVLSWNTMTPYSQDTGHLSRAVIYRPQLGGLEVTQRGVYNVYSQLIFRSSSSSDFHSVFVQCLCRTRPKDGNTSTMVLCTRTTKLNMTDAEVDQPSRLQAAIHLDIGDTIFVNVSDIRSVFKAYRYNYFGLFKI